MRLRIGRSDAIAGSSLGKWRLVNWEVPAMSLNKDFRRFALMGGAAVLALTVSAPAFAQDAAVEENAGQPVEEGEEIVVTGFRAALESAVAAKKETDQIVESVSAEDIGKLPDQSIAESIARLPGLASQRIPGSGRTSYISVRGLGPDFSTTTLNGRLQTSTSDVRNVEYDQFPSEIVSGVDIYKTMNASLIGQGLVGSVNIKTVRPLDYSRQLIAVGARGIYTDSGKLNPDSNEFGYRVNGTYIDQFANDTLGVAFSASYANEPYQVREERAWDPWPGSGTTADPYRVNGLATWNNSTTVKRLGLTGTVQYEITPEWTATVDAFYSNFRDDQTRRGIELPLACCATLSNTTVENGIVTGGTFSNVQAVVNNHAYERESDLYSFGGNLHWEGNDGWSAFFDVAWSKTDRLESILETNAGTGAGAAGANDTVDVVLRGDKILITNNAIDFSDPTQIFITDPNGWGGGAPSGRQHGYLNNRVVDDEIMQFSAQVERELDGNVLKAIRVGANHVAREKSLAPEEFYLIVAGGSLQATVPSQYLLDPVESWVGLGPVIAYDARGLLNDGFFEREANVTENVLGKAFSLNEKVTGIFAMADINHEFADGVLTGNVGVLAQHTDQQSDGYLVTAATGLEPFSDGDKFWDVLPSLNLSMRFNGDFVVRFAAARQLMRPRMDDMAARFSYGYDLQRNIISGSSGNPRLRPYRANAVDFTLEKYWGTRGYIAAQFFFKELDSMIYSQTVDYDWTGFPIPDPRATNPAGVITTPINAQGGELYGVEVGGTLPFETFAQALEGFGVTGGASYTVPKVKPGADAPEEDIPGYSRWVANGTAYFEKWGFNARGSVRYRSSYQGDFSGLAANRTRRRIKSETVLDAQLGYDFQQGSALEGLSVFLQGLNLTDEPLVSHDPAGEDLTLNYEEYGRRFMLGATYKF